MKDKNLSTMDILYKRSVLALLLEQKNVHERSLHMYDRLIREGKITIADVKESISWHRHVIGFCSSMITRIKRKRNFAAWVDSQSTE